MVELTALGEKLMLMMFLILIYLEAETMKTNVLPKKHVPIVLIIMPVIGVNTIRHVTQEVRYMVVRMALIVIPMIVAVELNQKNSINLSCRKYQNRN